MPPTATPPVGAQHARPNARKSFIPAIPRALEKKKPVQNGSDLASPLSISENKSDSLNQSGQDHAVAEPVAGGSDWASMVADEHSVTSPSGESLTPDPVPASAVYKPIANGHVTPPQEEESAPSAAFQNTSAGYTNPRPTNGVLNAFSSDSAPPPQRFAPGIVFGGSVVSNESSPTIPPSAASTIQTQPTPLSDAVSARTQSTHRAHGHTPHPSSDFHALGTKLIHPLPPHTHEHPPVIPPQLRSNHHFLPHPPRPEVDHTQAMARNNTIPEAQALSNYLVTQFNNAELSDLILEVRAQGQTAHLSLHSVIAARSGKIRSLLASGNFIVRPDSKKYMVLEHNDKYVGVSAIVAALRSCYGASPTASHYTSTFPAPPLADERGFLSLEMCLSYLATGHLLQINEVAMVGIEAAKNLLSVDNLEFFFTFCLAGSLETFEQPSNDSVGSAGINHTTYAPYSIDAINAAINFLISRLTNGFELDASAPASEKLNGVPYFPARVEIGHKRMASHPRLGFIQFGQTEQDPHNVILSTILLSLPFEVLQHVLGNVMAPSLSEAVVTERTRRSKEYLKRRRAQNDNSERLLGEHTRVYWEEYVEQGSSNIHRHWNPVE